MNNDNQTPWQQIDFTLLFFVFLLMCISTVAIYSAQASLPGELKNFNFAGRQLTWYFIGAFVLSLTLVIDFDRFKQLSWYLYGFGVFLLILLAIMPEYIGSYQIAPVTNGAKSWFVLPGLGSVQPSEFMKIFLIITIASTSVNHHEKHQTKTIQTDLILLAKIFGIAALPLLIVMAQPDLGTAMVFTAIVVSITLVSGVRWRLLSLLSLLGVAGIATFVFIFFKFPAFFKEHLLDDYQLARFYGWLAPEEYADAGYQATKAILAIGSGKLEGKGYSDGTVYFPEAHTDFIFAVIGEEFGFIGASITISIFFLLVYRMIHTALESNESFGSYLCAGVIGMLTFQVFQNIGMTIRILPITGIPLPFVSYGGSALLTYMIAVGLVLNVRSRTKTYMFE
ncbi:rod shape-determining protein RodA [Bacillus sp. NTK071]|uniref:FtsW/RodA/SpoVE family cell cycle protein n=1 Tax=Bacillus sp. NTK071 TaxID=2802175 RepID=UPI001A8E657A|nr:FtsW/RodA/SpoVE family cell cycle protein [Bacillus sp. NTK071]MBN8207246.1 rod shape-determining protein RodA [Bacillus sp. NTK071]